MESREGINMRKDHKPASTNLYLPATALLQSHDVNCCEQSNMPSIQPLVALKLGNTFI